MILDRVSTCSQITQEQIFYRAYYFIPRLVTLLVWVNAEKIFKEKTEEFLKTESLQNKYKFIRVNRKEPQELLNNEFVQTEKNSNIQININNFDTQIKNFLDTKLYELVHCIFSKIYLKLTDNELVVLSKFPSVSLTSASYSNAHRHFDLLLEEHAKEIQSLPELLEKQTYEFMGNKAIQKLKKEVKKEKNSCKQT